MHVESRLQMPNVTGAEAQAAPAGATPRSPYRQNRWSWPGVGRNSTSWRMCKGLGWDLQRPQLRDLGRSVQRAEGLQWKTRTNRNGEPCKVTTCQRVSTRCGGVGPVPQWPINCGGTSTAHDLHGQPEPGARADLVRSRRPCWLFHHSERRHRRYIPEQTGMGRSPPPEPGVPMVVDYVEVARAVRERRDPTTPPPTTTTSTPHRRRPPHRQRPPHRRPPPRHRDATINPAARPTCTSPARRINPSPSGGPDRQPGATTCSGPDSGSLPSPVGASPTSGCCRIRRTCIPCAATESPPRY